jgi:hypothetical protein
MVEQRFREANDYASAHRFLSGFPNFHQSDYGLGTVYGTILLGADVAEWRDIPARDLGSPPGGDVGARFRAANDWAGRNGYAGGFPNFHQADYGNGVVYGTILLKPGTADWRDVPARELGNPQGGDVGARFRATNDWALRNGYATGFPNFHQADYGNGVVYGTILLKHGTAHWRDVYEYVMGIFSRFTFDAAISAEQRLRTMERHSFALSRHASCGNITRAERNQLLRAYRRSIRHGINTDPTANASAIVGGSEIWINFNNLFPQNDNEVAQTLIHEMMHCAGYSHPRRIDRPAPNPDVPGDNGPYYGTPPLRAELCIAGAQSDAPTRLNTYVVDPMRSCVEINGRFTVLSETSPSLHNFSEEPEGFEQVQQDADLEPFNVDYFSDLQEELNQLRERINRLERGEGTGSQ